MSKKKRKPQKLDVGNLKSSIKTVEIDNPMFSRDHAEGNGNRRKATAFMNMRESPAVWMFSHNQIDLAQFEVAKKFRSYYEGAGGFSVSSIDYSQDVVDGGSPKDGITEHRHYCAQMLKKAKEEIGEKQYILVERVCGECVFLKDLGYTGNARKSVGSGLINSLDDLAEVFEISTKRNQYWKDIRVA